MKRTLDNQKHKFTDFAGQRADNKQGNTEEWKKSFRREHMACTEEKWVREKFKLGRVKNIKNWPWEEKYTEE